MSIWRNGLIGLAVGASLFVGSTAASAASYRIEAGDTFWLLSKRFGLPLKDVLAANPGVDPLRLQIGQIVRLPDPAPQKAVQATTLAASTKSAAQSNTVVTADGRRLAFKKVISAKATAYSADPSENTSAGAVDYFGNPLKLGTVAVDPSVIPFGSKLYITGYRFDGLPAGGLIGTALDTGSAIKGNRIDLFIPGSKQYVSRFGIQDVTVYVLE